MAKYSAIKALVDAYIKRNGKKEITGSILNSVLTATIDSLGKYYQFAGSAMPTDNPGTPDQNVCYLAGEPGIYTNFGRIIIFNEEVALLFWDGTWKKKSILIGIREVSASVDNNTGIPSVDVSYSQGNLVLTFHNLKGDKGDTGAAAGFGTIGADVDGNIGTPGVSVETSGTDTAKNLMFHFTNLKGETGVTSVVATIDDTIGTPSCQVSLVGQQLTLAFSGLKGVKGDTGVSADFPITIYNGLDSDATDQALAAAQGKILDGKVTQLEAKVGDFIKVEDYSSSDILSGTLHKYLIDANGIWKTGTARHARFPVSPGTSIKVVGGETSTDIAFLFSNKESANGESADIIPGSAVHIPVNTSVTATAPAGAVEMYVFVGYTSSTPQYKNCPNSLSITYLVLSDGIVSTNKLADNAVSIDKMSITETTKPKNLLDPDSLVTGKVIAVDGTELEISNSYGYYGLIPVKPETAYHISNSSDRALCAYESAYIAFYDNAKAFISSVWAKTTDITTPAGCSFVSISVTFALATMPQMEEGTYRSTYEPYFVPFKTISKDFFPENDLTGEYIKQYDGKLINLEYSVIDGIPGNTEAHFMAAVNAGIFNALKADMRLTSDNEIVLCHDAGFTFDENSRITTYDSSNATPIHDLALASVLALEFAQQVDGVYVHPCTLETYLRICKRFGMIPFITLRRETWSEAVVQKMYTLLQKYALESKVIINLYPADPELRYYLYQADKNLLVCDTKISSSHATIAELDKTASMGCRIACFRRDMSSPTSLFVDEVTEEFLSYASEKGIRIWGWGGITTQERFGSMFNAGCVGITNNTRTIS